MCCHTFVAVTILCAYMPDVKGKCRANSYWLVHLCASASDSFSRFLALYKFVCMYVCMTNLLVNLSLERESTREILVSNHHQHHQFHVHTSHNKIIHQNNIIESLLIFKKQSDKCSSAYCTYQKCVPAVHQTAPINCSSFQFVELNKQISDRCSAH